jgi:hypothetical protein
VDVEPGTALTRGAIDDDPIQQLNGVPGPKDEGTVDVRVSPLGVSTLASRHEHTTEHNSTERADHMHC